MWKRRIRSIDREIAPDEIFLDAANQEGFDQSRLEGRIEQPLARSTFFVLGSVLGLGFLVLAAQAWNLQINQGTAYAAQSERNSLSQETIFAKRGVIFDREGGPLVTNETTEADCAFSDKEAMVSAFKQSWPVFGYFGMQLQDA